LLSAAFVAVSEHVPAALVTLTVVPVTEQPVDAPALKLSPPVPLPPVAVAVPVVPKVTLAGPVTFSVAWFAVVKVTANVALVSAA
jgi:hypothetical protein